MPSPAQDRDANLAELEAHDRHRAVDFANPAAKAAYDRFTERIQSRDKHS